MPEIRIFAIHWQITMFLSFSLLLIFTCALHTYERHVPSTGIGVTPLSLQQSYSHWCHVWNSWNALVSSEIKISLHRYDFQQHGATWTRYSSQLNSSPLIHPVLRCSIHQTSSLSPSYSLSLVSSLFSLDPHLVWNQIKLDRDTQLCRCAFIPLQLCPKTK